MYNISSLVFSLMLLAITSNAQVKKKISSSKINKVSNHFASKEDTTINIYNLEKPLDIKAVRKGLRTAKKLLNVKLPTYVYEDELYNDLSFIDSVEIRYITVVYPKNALKKYGTKAKSGVLIINKTLLKIQIDNSDIMPVYKDDGNLPENNYPKEIKEDPNKVYEKVEIDPTYNGDFNAFLEKNLIFPDCDEKITKCEVTMLFIVEKDSTISNLVMSPQSKCNNVCFVMEAKKIIEKTNGKWKPGIQNGNVVRSYYEQKIVFEKKKK